jgi:hypothetical protein
MTPLTAHRIQLLGIVAAAAVLLLTGSWYSYTSTFDTATVGLMSVNICKGASYPLFFYGQPYFGALEAYLAALFISVFGFSEFTVSLAPICFTLGWIVFTSLLFTRLLNRTAGLIAAICVAFPGYYIFWYSIASYGGYSAILCLGTAILWLSLLIFQENPGKKILFLYSFCLGLLTALALWVHALTFPYIVIVAGVLALFTVRERFRKDIVLSLGVAFLVALTGFLPFYLETGSIFGGLSKSVQITWSGIVQALSTLFAVNIYELVVWNFLSSFDSAALSYLIVYGNLFLLLSAFICAFLSLVSSGRLRGKIYYLIPLTFCLLFLILYVQHHMATVKAPRYAIGFWTMLLCIFWTLAIAGQKELLLKRISSLFFCCWIAIQVTGTVLFITGNSEGARREQQTMQAVVEAARKNNLRSVVTYGEPLFGYKALKLNMFSQNTVVFAHADLERSHDNAQFTELDSKRGYLTNAQSKISLQNTLTELGIRFKVTEVNGYSLFSNVQAKQRYSMRVVPPEAITALSVVDNNLLLLNDGNQETGYGLTHYPIILDTGEIQPLCGIWMFTGRNPSSFSWVRPGQFEVSVSRDGIQYEKVYSSLPNTGNGFHAGDHFFIGGPWGKAEALFEPVHARYLKINFPDKNTPPITELFIFQTDSEIRRNSPDDLVKIKEIITDLDLQFVLADRWVSANLLEMFKGTAKKQIALPRHSTKFVNKPIHYFVRPGNGQAVVCDTAVADFCRQILTRQYGEAVISRQFDLQNYSLFALADIDGRGIGKKRAALLWNGHVPLQTDDLDMLAPWLPDLGIPVWRAEYSKTKGIYHDSWTNGAGKLKDLAYRIQGEQELIIYTNGWRPGADPAALNLKVVINKNMQLKFKDKVGNAYLFLLPDSLDILDSIEIQSTTFIPPGPDSRSLGLDIKRVEIR